MTRHFCAVAVALVAGCSVEKMPPVQMVHHGTVGVPKRVVVLPTECIAAQAVVSTVDPKAWCHTVDQMVASELAFRGIEVVDLAKLPVFQRSREIVDVTSIEGSASSEHRRVTVVGPTYSDVDMWTERRALAELGITALVRVRTSQVETWPLREIAMVRVTRADDAALIEASMCELEVSRISGDIEPIERAVRCALKGLDL